MRLERQAGGGVTLDINELFGLAPATEDDFVKPDGKRSELDKRSALLLGVIMCLIPSIVHCGDPVLAKKLEDLQNELKTDYAELYCQ
jgi:hypothetical protein